MYQSQRSLYARALYFQCILKSDELSDEANLYDEAVNQISFIAETFKASDDPLNFADNFHLETVEGASEHSWVIYYSEDWYATDSVEDAYVMLKLELLPEKDYDSGRLYSLNLEFYKLTEENAEKVIAMTCKKYYPGGAK